MFSGELAETLRDDVEEAADVCPLQAITIED
jgi:ferredoxin